MIPLYDENRSPGYIPWATLFIIVISTLCFLFSFSNLDNIIEEFGFVPQKFFKTKNFLPIFTSMFLHGSFFHLLGNMWFLWIFGNNLERKLKRWKFIIFYFICGIFSLLFYAFLTDTPNIPVIGASGAISGILGGYFIAFPTNRITTLVPGFFLLYTVSIPAGLFGLIWFIYQFLSLGSNLNIAFLAHIGGFLMGALLMRALLKKRRYELF
jgi:membrane associated rhomboid family serine protease